MSRTRAKTPHLFDKWDGVAARIREASRLVMLLDFDGTLARIAPRPDRARLRGRTRRILQKLADHPRVTLAVISGRPRAELQERIGIRRIQYLGLYGWENNGNARVPVPAQLALARTLANLEGDLSAVPGVWIEPKRSSFSIHLLGAGGAVRQHVRRRVTARLQPIGSILRMIPNLRDIEIAPAAIGDKGVAVRKFLGERAMGGALAVYFGDDLSDEPAFGAVRKGIPILVGRRRKTRARFYLRGPEEVASALSRMEAMLR